MPAILDDPLSPHPPAPAPISLPQPKTFILRDNVTVATIYPVHSASTLPQSLLRFLSKEFNDEVERGDTYPMTEVMAYKQFGEYWFGTFGAVLLIGEQRDLAAEEEEERDWEKECLGTFYIKPNYPGRCSHNCNAGFLTTAAARGRGCGKVMGTAYLEYAKQLGYRYSVFNLVFETNVASTKIWDSLGFERIGRVKGVAKLKSYPDRFVDAIIYGKDLVGDEAN
ncbi:Protein spt10 [Rhizina undulata]